MLYDRPSPLQTNLRLKANPRPRRSAPSVSCAKWVVALAVTLSTPGSVTALAQTSTPASPLVCDLTAYTRTGGIAARVSGDVLLVEWPGAEGERLRLGLSIVDGTPTIAELALRGESEAWTTLATDAGIELWPSSGSLGRRTIRMGISHPTHWPSARTPAYQGDGVRPISSRLPGIHPRPKR